MNTPNNEPEFLVDNTRIFREVAIPLFRKFIDQPIQHLEIGVYEGRSACWLLDYILTHPEAHFTGIDPWIGYEEQYHRAVRNLHRYGSKVTLIRGESSKILPTHFTSNEIFHTIYIDGCHSYQACRVDLKNTWPLLKPGGIVLCDDYNRDDYGVKRAVDEFLSALPEDTWQLLYKDYPIAWTKR